GGGAALRACPCVSLRDKGGAAITWHVIVLGPATCECGSPAMSPLAMAVLAIISAIWGASFLSIRVAAPGFGAFGLAEIRCALATVLMLVFLVARKQALWPRKPGAEVVLLGLATSAAPFVLIAYAAFTLPASMLVILQSTMPLFALLFASAARLDRITPRKVVGLLCGLAGVVLVAGWSSLALDRSVVIAVFAS